MRTGLQSKIDKQGRLVVPAEVREELGFEPDVQLWLTWKDGVLHVETVEHAVKQFIGIARRNRPDLEGRSIVDEFIADRRAEGARE